jgi:Fic family protein
MIYRMQFVRSSLHDSIIRRWKLVDSKRPLSRSILQNLREVFQTEFTYNSNAIEGNTLSLRETQLVIEEGQTISGKSLREIYEAKNHPEAIKYVEELAQENRTISEHDILTLHGMIMKDVLPPSEVGRYRKGEVRIRGSKHVPPPAYDVPPLMQEFVNLVNDNPEDYTTAELAAVALHRLVFIHPFNDGNGRVARLITNLILMKKRYFPIIILKSDRLKYLNYLSLADKNQNYSPLVNSVAQYIVKHLDLVLRAIEQTTRDKMISFDEAEKHFPMSATYLRVLANKGLIPAVKEGRNWTIQKSELDKYVREHRRKRN